MSKINEGYEFKTAIVGESNYKTALKKCYNDPNAYRKGQGVFLDVTLKLENNNKYDDQAVAVVSKYGIIGYLPKDTARKYRKDWDEQDGNTVRAKVTTSDPKSNLYGVWIDLRYGNANAAGGKVEPVSSNTNKSFWSKIFG